MALKGCCGCCRLREGVLSIGITFLVLTILGALVSIPNWVALGAAEGEVAHDIANREAAEQAFTVAKISISVQTVEILLALLFNSLLIHGVRRSMPGMMLAWMVYYGIVFTLASLGGVFLLIAGIYISAAFSDMQPLHVNGLELGSTLGAIFAVCGVVSLGMLAFFWYLWAVVATYRREVLEQTGDYKREMLMEESPPAYQPYSHAE